MTRFLVTGAAGFIGFHTVRRLLGRGDTVIGLDNLNAYYDVRLKEARLAMLLKDRSFQFEKIDLTDATAVARLFAEHRFERVVHLGAQAGVRYSIENPRAYVDSNVTGTLNVLEGCRHTGVGHLVYASTSSVYGANTCMPFGVHQTADHPLTFYAATKRANELMAHAYSSLFELPTTGLRFFTVYGPWGRPDMALFRFTERILAGQPIDVYNFGQHKRDFTYVDDIVEGIVRVADQVATSNAAWDGTSPDPGTSGAPWRVFNIGNGNPVPLLRYIEVLGECLGRKAQMNLLPMQVGDVPNTFADVSDLAREVGYAPNTSVDVGVRRFVEWYCEYYDVKTTPAATHSA